MMFVTRFLLVAFTAVLALGATLDATVHRSEVGTRTVGHQRANAASSAEIPRDRSVATLVGTASLLDWYTLPLALREFAPGVELIIDSGGSARNPLSEVHLRAIGAVRSVRFEDLSSVVLPSGESDITGEAFWYGPWALFAAEGQIDVLLLFPSDDITRIVDARRAFGAPETSGVALPAAEVTSARAAERAPSFARALVLETIVFIVFLLLGGLLVPRDVASPTVRVTVALLVGVALHSSAGLFLLPGPWGILLTIFLGGALGSLSRHLGWVTGWVRGDLRLVFLASSVIALIVAWARWTTFLVLTPDSRDYWSGGALFADGVLRPGLIEVKRGLSLQALHAVGFAGAIEGLQALNAVVLGAVCAGLLGLGAARSPGAFGARITLAALVVIGFVMSPQIRSIGAFLSGHALVAALLFGLLLLIGFGSESFPDRLPVLAILPLLGALVLTRAEGAVLAGAVLLGALAVEPTPRRWQGAWLGLSGFTFAWSAVLWAGDIDRSGAVSTGTLILGAIAVGAAFMAALVMNISHAELLRRVPSIVLGALWAGLAVVGVTLGREVFFEAAFENLFRGEGGWGVYGILMILAGTLAVAQTPRRPDVPVAAAVWFVLAYVPITVFVKLGDGLQAADADLSILFSGGGRVGWGDSVNRMWLHIVPILLALLVVHLPSAQRDVQPRERARAAMVLIPAVVACVLWQPRYVPVSDVEEFVVHSSGGSEILMELSRGVSVEQVVELDETVVPVGAVPVRICASIPFGTYGRDVTGDVEIQMVVAQGVASRTVRGSQAVDWAAQRICIDLEATASNPVSLPSRVLVRVFGIDAEPGSALGVLEGASGGTPPVARLPNGSLAFEEGTTGPLAAVVTVGYVVGADGFDAVLDQLVPVLPWVGLWFAVPAGVLLPGRIVRPGLRRGRP